MSTLIIYSGGSNTTAVAEYIAGKTSGKAVKVASAGSEDLSSYDSIVFGTRVHAGRIPKDLTEFVEANKSALSGKNTAFYLCCMYNDEKGQKQVQGIAEGLGFSKYAFFNKAKKIIQEDNNEVDAFISKL
jgi:menaquinone-dependent protoporphyrinogen oxidase